MRMSTSAPISATTAAPRTPGETPAEQALYGAANAYAMLTAGFTTVQSIGAPSDVPLRAAIAGGRLPGPRLLTAITPLTDTSLTIDQVRAHVRKAVADGADVIKIFASKSIRDGGGQTLSDEQINAACGEAKALGKRVWVHAHAASAVRAAALAGCTTVTHGSQITDAEADLMAARGTYFEPQTGLLLQNYIENKARYMGIGNYNEAGFKFMEDGIPLNDAMFRMAIRHKDLKITMGTDAVAGAHGRNANEVVHRVKVGGQGAMDAIVGGDVAQRRGARPAGLDRRAGARHGSGPDRGRRRPAGRYHGAAAGGVRDEGRGGVSERGARQVRLVTFSHRHDRAAGTSPAMTS